jgi:predicted helicase
VYFIIHSVNEVLQSQFGQTLGSKGVHIMDPFTGTGTFITRLLQSGLIAPEEMENKFRNEIHANEIVLLAYYIAAINIEAVYHGLNSNEAYVPFEGICLTDTFQMYESNDLISHYLPDNSERRKRQKETGIRVIFGNPPYSVGQESANDDAANVSYPTLDGRVRDTYAALTNAQNKNGLYNSYIRALRWASDRIGEDGGVVAFVTNGGWLEGNTGAGIRKTFEKEFSDIFVFNLRGNATTTGERRRKEKGNVFGAGTRTPITISVLVRNPNSKAAGRIHYHDIGDYLEERQKLSIIREFASISGITQSNGWTALKSDEHGDWINQRDDSFEQFIKMGDKKDNSVDVLFDTYSSGVKTQRDPWCFNRSRTALETNIKALINVYEDDRANKGVSKNPATTDPRQVKWTRALLKDFERDKPLHFDADAVVRSIYRPFTKEWLYFDRRLNEMVYKMNSIYPNAETENRTICVAAPGHAAGFSVMMTDSIVELCVSAMKGGTQCFPLFVYEERAPEDDDLFSDCAGTSKRSGITKAGLQHFQQAYSGEKIFSEDVFYYTYGVLHSAEYRDLYGDNLTKELPRIPLVKSTEDFWRFVTAGRRLGELHVNFESAEPYRVIIKQGDLRTAVIENPEAFYRVEKMRFAGTRGSEDKTTVIYNSNITMQNIPLEAYDYVVNGKPALVWVMERQGVLSDKVF